MLVQPYSLDSNCWSKLQKRCTDDHLSAEEVVNLYQGFEGELIDILPFPEDPSEQSKAIENLKSSNPSNHKNVILLFDETHPVSDEIKSDTRFVGYEVGICDQDNGFYSSIFNEILFGKIHSLISYKSKLNRHLLFEKNDIAEEYLKLHQTLADQGEDVESYYQMSIYAVHKLK